MFLGMVIVLGIHFLNVLMRQSRKTGDIEVHLLESGKDKPAVKQATFWEASKLIAIPAILDLLATALCFVGILYNSASVFQMLRGSMIIFSALLSVLFLRKRLHAYHWAGVGLCCLAIVVVGYSNMMATSSSSTPSDIPQSKVVFGMALIVLGQVIQASQVVLEEKLLRGYSIEPFQIVGMEGVWGSLAMLLVFFPALYLIPGSDAGGAQENLYDTIVMMQNNKNLQYLVLLYVFSVFTYNMSGMLVTYALSAVHRTMLEASRTAVIWLIDLVIHYYICPSSSFGETWSSWSWLQLLGFGILILGQSVYSELVQIPGLYYPPRPIVAQIESIQASPASVRYNVMIPEGAEEEVVLVVDDNRQKGL
jgi:drug/metabolite transporter (DMT)-like permease